MISAIAFIFKTLIGLYILVLLMRFWFPLFNIDFRNPIAQSILRLTSPIIMPFRRFIPSIGKIDIATLIVTFFIEYLLILILTMLLGIKINGITVAIQSLFELAIKSTNLIFLAIFFRAILSWINPHSYSPITNILHSIAEPVQRPFRKIMPAINGLDLSAIFAIIFLQAILIILEKYSPLFI